VRIEGLAFWEPGQVDHGREEQLPDFESLPPSRDTVTSTLLLDREARECPVTFHYRVNLVANTGSADVVADYRPWIARAREQAEALWQATRCPASCPKKPLVEELVEWTSAPDAAGNVVVSVKSEWSVECTQRE
jgi:hypothetical protein